ncbi:MAG: hypothetical protein GWO81_04970 [Verrucomicrobia bacterium]|nr:hypothetical protein [Verrucomicrobiota bacterium]
MLRSRLFLLVTSIALLCLSGCANYEWNRPALPFKTIYVQPVTNDSLAPQAQASLSTQTRQALIRDGRLQLVSNPAEAEAILQVNLTQYRRNTGARSSADTEIALAFDLILEAQIALYNPSTNDYYLKARKVSADTSTFSNRPETGEDNLSLSEYQAMPRLTRSLGDRIANEILGVW